MKINKLMKYFLLLSTVVLLLFAAFSCHSPTGPNNYLSLTLEDVSCTEAWLKVTGETGSEVILNRDNIQVQKFTLNSSPQTIYDDSLLPSKTYTYQAVLNNEKSSKITAATLDTTSSNFTWQVDTIGAQGSILYDVDVINDTLAYAVGLIMPSDPAKRSNTIYWDNAAVWNGVKWTTMQIPSYYNGKKTFSTVYSVFARNENDIWFGLGYLAHWNGTNYSQVDPQLQSVENKISESPDGSQLYVVGNYGNISYSSDQGSSWQKVQTGTTLPFQDIWGDGGQVLAVASDKFGLGGKYLVSLNGNTATALNDSIPTAVSLSGIWFSANQKYYLVGDGVMTKHLLSNKLWQYDYNRTAASYYSFAVRGEGINNVVIAGGYGDVSFYNGKQWTEYKQLYNTIDQLRSVSIKGSTIIAAGVRTYNGIQYYGLVYVGRR